MDAEVLDLGIRRFLKEFGVTAQQAIEEAGLAGLRSGKLDGTETVLARARLEVPELGTFLDIERTIPLE
jgi:hypothetical protein